MTTHSSSHQCHRRVCLRLHALLMLPARPQQLRYYVRLRRKRSRIHSDAVLLHSARCWQSTRLRQRRWRRWTEGRRRNSRTLCDEIRRRFTHREKVIKSFRSHIAERCQPSLSSLSSSASGPTRTLLALIFLSRSTLLSRAPPAYFCPTLRVVIRRSASARPLVP